MRGVETSRGMCSQFRRERSGRFSRVRPRRPSYRAPMTGASYCRRSFGIHLTFSPAAAEGARTEEEEDDDEEDDASFGAIPGVGDARARTRGRAEATVHWGRGFCEGRAPRGRGRRVGK
jgi:hypothetical protein